MEACQTDALAKYRKTVQIPGGGIVAVLARVGPYPCWPVLARAGPCWPVLGRWPCWRVVCVQVPSRRV